MQLVWLIDIFVSLMHSAHRSLIHALDLRQPLLTFLHLDILCRVQSSCTRLTWLCVTCFTSDQERIGYSDYSSVSTMTLIDARKWQDTQA